MTNKNPNPRIDDIKNELLKRPWEFLNIIRTESQISKSFFEESPVKEEILEDIKQSSFRENFEGLTGNEIYDLFLEFKKEIGIIKKWILNSEVRTKTFIELGKLGKATATEIGGRISKHSKSVSTYINEFKEKKGWVGDPERDGREKWYSFTEMGQSYFTLAMNRGWFKNIIRKELSIDETIIRVYYSRLYPETNGYAMQYVENREPDHYSMGLNYYFVSGLDESWPRLTDLISKILDIVYTMAEKLRLEIILPEISSDDEDVSISINNADEDVLAMIFAAFNYLKRNKVRVGEFWEISKIKIINVNSYFNADMPDIHENEGFMTNEETDAFIKKVLTNFKNKLNHEKVD